MSRNTPFRLRVLGPVTIRHEADPVTSSRITQPRHVALLCYLALARPRGLHSRDTLIALLWPEHDDGRGRRALRNALYGLRQELGNAAVVSTGDHLIGLDPAQVSCDAHDLERGAALDELPDVPEPLQGLHVDGAAEFEHWMAAERDRLRLLISRRARARAEPSAALSTRNAQHRYSPDAWVMHARGHYLFLRTAHGGPPADLLRCGEYFEKALALDPNFAPALAGLANFHAVAARRGVLSPFREVFAKVIELSERALGLDPSLAVPHVHFGVKALYLDDDWERAGTEFATAVAKEPGYAEGHRFFGVWLGHMGRHGEALQQMEIAVELEPDITHLLSSLAAARLAVGDREGAELVLRRTLVLEPKHAAARERLIRMLEESGRYDEALAERTRVPPTPGAGKFAAALTRGVSFYEQVVREELEAEAAAIEARLLEPHAETVNDIFSPPVVRLVSLYARLGNWKRARSWELQEKARRPGLANWFASLPEWNPAAPASSTDQSISDEGVTPRGQQRTSEYGARFREVQRCSGTLKERFGIGWTLPFRCRRLAAGDQEDQTGPPLFVTRTTLKTPV